MKSQNPGRNRMKPVAVLRIASIVSFLVLAGGSFAMSPPPGKQNAPSPPPAKPPAHTVEDGQGAYRFTPAETAEIRGYFRTVPPPPPAGPPGTKKQKSLPPGLRKKVERGGELPPGWQKKIARGEVMDAQVYAYARPLPTDLLKRLPPPPRGTIVVTVEGKVVRLMEATMTILDLFDLL